MKDSSPDPNQMSFMAPNLLDQLNPKHPLLQLAKTIPWDFFESEFTPLYSTIGRPAKPVRLMVGLSILKHMENVSDDVVVQHWVMWLFYKVQVYIVLKGQKKYDLAVRKKARLARSSLCSSLQNQENLNKKDVNKLTAMRAQIEQQEEVDSQAYFAGILQRLSGHGRQSYQVLYESIDGQISHSRVDMEGLGKEQPEFVFNWLKRSCNKVSKRTDQVYDPAVRFKAMEGSSK